MADNFVSQARYAAYRGVSRKTVTTWKQKGLLVLDEAGRVDVAATDEVLPKDAEWRKIVTQGNSPDTGSLVRKVLAEEGLEVGESPLTLTHVRMAVGILKAREQAIANDKERGALIEIEQVGAVVADEYATIRANFVSLPGDVAADLEHLTAPEIQEVLAAKVSQILDALSADETYSGKEAA
ncbi:hypothetical protein AB2N04_14680 [Nitratireductor sp. GISD-1A_MAKvit]|uniref:hypothetical protein n=1 Tax=Nitratireductor sp. GISD-1A_MAKvit TaxID=3234198 RepID=UPI0034663714